MRLEIFLVALLLCSGIVFAAIAECPTYLSTKYMDIPEAYTFQDLNIASCSQITGTVNDWNDYCTKKYSTDYRTVYACCSDALKVAVCYIGKRPTTLDDNLAYKMFMGVANGETGIRSCDTVSNKDYSVASFDFTQYGLSACNDQQGSYYFAWDDKCTDAMGSPGYSCCSDSMKKIRCYIYKTPSNFMFEYIDDYVSESGTVRFKYYADNTIHYEAQDWNSDTKTWGSWTSIGTFPCQAGCSGNLVGTPGLHKMRVRACGGPKIGEACTASIEDSFTTLAQGQTPADGSSGSGTSTGTTTSGDTTGTDTSTTGTQPAIAACPTDLSNVNVFEYLTFSNLSISQCSELYLSQSDADKYCHDKYPEATGVQACCSDDWKVSGCYNSGETSDTGSTGTTTSGDTTGTDTSTTGTQPAIAACPTDLSNVNVFEYLDFSDLSISKCSELQLSQADADKYCHDQHPEAADVHACCSDDWEVSGCYSSPFPTDFYFKYVRNPVYEINDQLLLALRAAGVDHFEKQTSYESGPRSEWEDIGDPTCLPFPCKDTDYGAPGIHHTWMRACSGSGLGEGCTDPVEDSYTVLPGEEGVPTNFTFYFTPGSIQMGDEIFMHYNADKANHFELSYYNDPDNPDLRFAPGWTYWVSVTDQQLESNCRSESGCSLGNDNGASGVRKARMRACGGSQIGQKCTDPIVAQYVVLHI